MPKLYGKPEIRRRLLNDKAWCAYALSDLDDCRFPHSHWFGLPDDPSIGLLYCEFPNPVFFYHGCPRVLEQLLDEIPITAGTHLQLQPDALDLVAARTSVPIAKQMIRMRLRELRLGSNNAVALTLADAADLEALYADGASTGESPDFFFPSMLDGGYFHGVRQNGAITAAAGTHVVSHPESAAAIGNVYTHRDYRSQGLAQSVTSAVTRALLDAGIETVILNVAAHNAPAICVYRKLGFEPYCDFFEAVRG